MPQIIGVFHSDEKVVDKYFLDELFYDSELEKENIKTEIKDVIVFSKIPKNSIKILVTGGKSYSPDFAYVAYVLKFKAGKEKLYFIIETKNTGEENLRKEEEQKVKHAKEFFGKAVKIEFRTQFDKDRISNLIQEI